MIREAIVAHPHFLKNINTDNAKPNIIEEIKKIWKCRVNHIHYFLQLDEFMQTGSLLRTRDTFEQNTNELHILHIYLGNVNITGASKNSCFWKSDIKA